MKTVFIVMNNVKLPVGEFSSEIAEQVKEDILEANKNSIVRLEDVIIS